MGIGPDTETVRKALAEIGPRYTRDIAAGSQDTKDLFAPLLAAAPRDGVTVQRDIPYGSDPRQVLDVFSSPGASGSDVLVFVHGGAFVRGVKEQPEGLYGNVLTWFARQGFVGVNVEYRLAPQAPYPQGALDVAAALEWVHAHIAAHGGNPARILLMGHSAGGTHVAGHVLDPAVQRGPQRARAMVLACARLRADVSPRNPNAAGVQAYFGDDPALYEVRSPVTHAHRCEIPVMVVTAEYDNPLLDVYGLEFAHRIGVLRGKSPRFVQCRGHNHMSVMAHFNTAEDALGREMLDFWAGC
jgi:acetyl esterase/lipase